MMCIGGDTVGIGGDTVEGHASGGCLCKKSILQYDSSVLGSYVAIVYLSM